MELLAQPGDRDTYQSHNTVILAFILFLFDQPKANKIAPEL